MSFIRVVFLVAILVSLAALILQNLTPLSLVFLGWRSLPLPLGVWIVAAIIAGMVTGVVLLLLLRLFSYLTQGKLRSRVQNPESGRSPRNSWSDTAGTASAFRSDRSTATTAKSEAAETAAAQNDTTSSSKFYEVEQRPSSGQQSGSTYSYSYRKTGNTGVGQRESVVDADYRVIVPPQHSEVDDADDWFEDDELDPDPDRRDR